MQELKLAQQELTSAMEEWEEIIQAHDGDTTSESEGEGSECGEEWEERVSDGVAFLPHHIDGGMFRNRPSITTEFSFFGTPTAGTYAAGGGV